METKSDTTILDLNMDVLDIIYRNLYYDSDQINFAKAHPHLSAAFVYHHPKRYTKIDLFEERRDGFFILEWFGFNILSLKDRSYRYLDENLTSQLVDLAAQYCPNVEVLEFQITSENVKRVEENLAKLTKLKNIIVHIYDNLNIENIVIILNQLRDLRRLTLNSGNIDNLAPMHNLEHIEYFEIRYLEDEHIPVLGNFWKNLKSLKTEATPKTLGKLSIHCEQLENLKLLDYNHEDMLPYFPKLKRLNILSWEEYGDNGSFVKTFHGKYNNQLEALELPRSCIESAKTARRISKLKTVKILGCQRIMPRAIRYIARMPLEKIILSGLEETELYTLLRECKTLKWIHLDNFKYLTKDNLDYILDILKSNGLEPENPFVLRIVFYRLCNHLKNELKMCSNKKLLDIQLAPMDYSMRYWRKNSTACSGGTLD